jgi:excisionase family DNA binding protein
MSESAHEPATLQRLAYSVAQAAVVSNLSRSKLYELMKANVLPSIKIGSRRLIRAHDLANLIESAGKP